MNYCLIKDAWGDDSSYCKSLDEKYFTYNSDVNNNLSDDNLSDDNLSDDNLSDDNLNNNKINTIKDNTTANVKRLSIYKKQKKNLDEIVKVQNKLRNYYKNIVGGKNKNMFSNIFDFIDEYMTCFLNFFDKKKTNLDIIYIGLFCVFLLNYKH